MTFHDLTKAWQELLQSSTYVADHVTQRIEIPMEFFDKFQKEFNLCFIEPDDDTEFKSWQNGFFDTD